MVTGETPTASKSLRTTAPFLRRTTEPQREWAPSPPQGSEAGPVRSPPLPAAMGISKYPELEGILFGSSEMQRLAEKRVDEQRAVKAAQAAEEQRIADEKAEALRQKKERIEQKRLHNEVRLQERARALAEEQERDAEARNKALEDRKVRLLPAACGLLPCRDSLPWVPRHAVGASPRRGCLAVPLRRGV